MKLVGPSGGALSSSDGNLAVSIPPGALPADVTITTEPATAPAQGAVGTVYEIGPTGTQFAMPVTLTLHYDAANLAGAAESSLRVATFAGGAWQLLPGAVVDRQAKTVSGVTTHLSPYAIVTEAAGKTCATVQVGFGCTDPGGAGPASGGGTSAACDPPTCAGASNVCAQYPGAAMDSCVDGPKGYTASCCFAPSAPICFATAAGFGCTDPGTGGGGGAGICPPPPTCATATAACAGFPGATLQNCTNNATGYAGACCFQPDAPVCVAVNDGARLRRHERRRWRRLLDAATALRRRQPVRAFRRRDGLVVHRYHRRLRGDLLLRGRHAALSRAAAAARAASTGPTAAFPPPTAASAAAGTRARPAARAPGRVPARRRVAALAG